MTQKQHTNENRKQARHDREETIFIEILAASNNHSQDNLMLECSTRDISENGLKIKAEYPFIVGSILELLISFESGGYKFLLTGEVKWCDTVDEKIVLAGFELVEAEHSDYFVWQRMFSNQDELTPAQEIE